MGIHIPESVRRIFKRSPKNTIQQTPLYGTELGDRVSKIVTRDYGGIEGVGGIQKEATRIASQVDREIIDSKASQLARIRQTDIDHETAKQIKEIAAKRNQDGFIDAESLSYWDVANILHGVGELMEYGTQHHESFVNNLGTGPVSPKHLKDHDLGAFTIERLKIGVMPGFKRDSSNGLLKPAGYGFGLWIDADNGPLEEQLIYEVAMKLDALGVPLAGRAAEFVSDAKTKK